MRAPPGLIILVLFFRVVLTVTVSILFFILGTRVMDAVSLSLLNGRLQEPQIMQVSVTMITSGNSRIKLGE
jgi:hypothetical protein